MTEKIEEEVEHMCNLSDGVENKGIQQGIQQELRRIDSERTEKMIL